jgi:hypothetical protein
MALLTLASMSVPAPDRWPSRRPASPGSAVGAIARGLRILAAAFCLISSGARTDDLAVVDAIESAYLIKLAPFVLWPPTVDAAAATLCILDDDKIAGLVAQAASNAVGSRPPVSVRRLAPGASSAGCHVLFIGQADGAAAATAFTAVAKAPVLTVTDQASPGHKGIVNFVIRDDRVRFEIDDREAVRHGLEISSKLLSLAVPAEPKP